MAPSGASGTPSSVVHLPALQRAWVRQAKAPGAPWLHQEVARRMAARLPVIKQAPSVWLDWSGFLGGGAEAVQAVWPEARRMVAEPCDALLQRSRSALKRPWWGWPRQNGPMRQVLHVDEVPAGGAQMVWANMVLHTALDPAALVARWHRALDAQGFVMFSSFGPDTLVTLRALYAAMGWPAPHAPFMDMHDVGDLVLQAGFADPVMDQETVELTWSSPEALLDELRGLGANLWPGRFQGLRTPRWRQRLGELLTERCSDRDGRLRLPFELVYGHAYRGLPKPARPETAVVSLAALRAGRPAR